MMITTASTGNSNILQRIAWLRLRMQLRSDLLEIGSSLKTNDVTVILKSFDALPYTQKKGHTFSSLWLPTKDDLNNAILPSLSVGGVEDIIYKFGREHLQRETENLQSSNNNNDDNNDSNNEIIQIWDTLDGLHRVGIRPKTKTNNSRRQRISRLGNKAKLKARLSQVSFPITKERLEWLHKQHHQTTMKNQEQNNEDTFLIDLYNVLIRYDGLGGGNYGSGNQAAIPSTVYTTFERWANNNRSSFCIEGFASPLNHRIVTTTNHQNSYFWSAFEDVDSPFGSLGSFFSSVGTTNWNKKKTNVRLVKKKKKNHHELLILNPPYLSSLISEIPNRLNDYLSLHNNSEQIKTLPSSIHDYNTTSSNSAKTTVLVVIPGDHKSAHKKLVKSSFFQGSITLLGGSHRFMHGLQHCRSRSKNVFHTSYRNTEVYVLSNFEDTTRTFDTLLKSIAESFRS